MKDSRDAARVGRGGLKLEAALDRFHLAARVRGLRAVDVGASTGGFTEVLLREGAAQVIAVDVGHGQLHARLRADPRVTSLEKTDWKTLSLSVAPGPFDFFTVDVSFVAARTMLRGLAFRLRAGAEGVVLVKPQFEVAKHLVKGGDVGDPALRARALVAFTRKAESLGFKVLDHADSPVEGGSGTVEILAHLRFDGRSARLPQPGETRGQPVRQRKSGPTGAQKWFAVAAPGLEDVVRAEVERLAGATSVRTVDGGVEFNGPIEVGMRANLHLRVATRVLLRLGQVKAREFSKLRRLLAKMAWDRFVPVDLPLRVSASTSRCRLFHTGAIADTVALAVGDSLGKKMELAAKRSEPKESEGEDQPDLNDTRILLRGVGDEWTVSLDSSGDLLHRRGARVETGRAPLRETLAAGVLTLCEYDPTLPFVDPMCGAGTIALEACAIATGEAAGTHRHFAFERWRTDPESWRAIQAEARVAPMVMPPAPIWGFDRDPAAIGIAQRNAERAGFASFIRLEPASFGDVPPPGPRGLVVLNPPYGRRLGPGRAPTALYRDIGRTLRAHFTGWRAGVLCPDAASATALGLRPSGTHALSNGGLRIKLLVIDISNRKG